jgi:hypothetical protein
MMTKHQSAALFTESQTMSRAQIESSSLKPSDGWSNGRRNLTPGFAICGGSEVSEQALRAIVRALFASGVLRPIDGKVWCGERTGNVAWSVVRHHAGAVPGRAR